MACAHHTEKLLGTCPIADLQGTTAHLNCRFLHCADDMLNCSLAAFEHEEMATLKVIASAAWLNLPATPAVLEFPSSVTCQAAGTLWPCSQLNSLKASCNFRCWARLLQASRQPPSAAFLVSCYLGLGSFSWRQLRGIIPCLGSLQGA